MLRATGEVGPHCAGDCRRRVIAPPPARFDAHRYGDTYMPTPAVHWRILIVPNGGNVSPYETWKRSSEAADNYLRAANNENKFGRVDMISAA